MVEIEAAVEARVSHSCSGLQGREGPSRAFCGSWLWGSWRDLLALMTPLIPDKVNFVGLECTVPEFQIGALSKCVGFILALHEHTQCCLSRACCPVPCDQAMPPQPAGRCDWSCSGESSSGKVVRLIFRTLFKDFFRFLGVTGDGQR